MSVSKLRNQILDTTGPRDVFVSIMALLSVYLYFLAYEEGEHPGATSLETWMWKLLALLIVLPFFLGVGPKLRVLSVLAERRSAEVKRKKSKTDCCVQEARGAKAEESPHSKYETQHRPTPSSSNKFKRLSEKLSKFSLQNVGKFLRKRGKGKEPESEAASPSSPTLSSPVSPQAFQRRLLEKLHFEGNKHEFFASTKFAGCLSEEAHEALFACCSWRVLLTGQTVFETGDSTASGLVMVVDGTLGVYGLREQGEVLHYELTVGESIGDLDLIHASTHRRFTVRAISNAMVLEISQESFRQFCIADPGSLLLFLRLALGRLHRVATFVVDDFLGLHQHAQAAASQHDVTVMDACDSELSSKVSSHFGALGTFASKLVERQDGEVLYSTGDTPRAFWVVFEGQVAITAAVSPDTGNCCEKRTSVIDAPCILGARQFMSAVERKETAVVKGASRIARFDIENLIGMAGGAPREAREVVDLVMHAAQSLFPTIKQFTGLGLCRHWYNVGETVFKEGDKVTDGLYILITGRVKLKSRHSNLVTELGRGDILGEDAILASSKHESKRLHTAVCMRDCELVKISTQNFETICAQHPHVALKLIQSIARRSLGSARAASMPYDTVEHGERMAGHSVTANLATIAVMPINSESEEAMQMLVRRLAEELRKFGAVLTLDVGAIARVLGSETVTMMHMPFYRTRIASWIVQQEEDYRFVLMQGHLQNEAWSSICVSQADSVLLAGNVRSPPILSEVEKHCVWNGQDGCVRAAEADPCNPDEAAADERMILDVRRELVVLHPGSGGLGSPPPPARCTKKLVSPRPGLALHHHVRLECPADIQRLARHLAGRSVGLVLGGGGARGLAHLGVLRAMEEVGMPVDFIGGTSQGAFMAALYAQWGHSSALAEGCKELCSGIGSVTGLLRDFTLPILSMFSGKSFSSTIRNALGSGDVRDTWLPFFCITTVINPVQHINKCRQTEHMRVHKRGPIWKYVRASMTLVNFLPPIFDNGELLVDGGYVNNLPADVMASMGVNTIIGVDVEDKSSVLAPEKLLRLESSVSGWFVLWRYFLEFVGLAGGRHIARHKDITISLCYIAHTTQFPRQRALLDLKLEPPCADVGLLDYHRKDEIIERAYKYALPLLQDFVRQSTAVSELSRATSTDNASQGLNKISTRRSSLDMPQMRRSVSDKFKPMWSDTMWSDTICGLPQDMTQDTCRCDSPELITKFKSSVDLFSETFTRKSRANAATSSTQEQCTENKPHVDVPSVN